MMYDFIKKNFDPELLLTDTDSFIMMLIKKLLAK